MSQNFDFKTAPITGVHLIEANAGTGKTYSLVSLYLKLILHGYRSQEIVAVTFGRSATHEINLRIKESLEELFFQIKQDKSSSNDPRIDYFIREFNLKSTQEQEAVYQSLREAVYHFSGNQIQTIHGFMGKLLQDFHFEIGELRSSQLIDSEEPYFKEAFHDFIRTYLSSSNRLLPDSTQNDFLLKYWLRKKPLLNPLFAQGYQPGVIDRLKSFFDRPNLRFEPFLKDKKELTSLAPFLEVKNRLLGLFDDYDQGNALLDAFLDPSFLGSQKRYHKKPEQAEVDFKNKLGTIFSILKSSYGLDYFFFKQKKIEKLFFWLAFFESGKLKSSSFDVKAYFKKFVWADRFFNGFQELISLGSDLQELLHHNEFFLDRNLIDTLRERVKHQKNLEGVYSYNDLILKLDQSLESHPVLLEAISRRYRAFLIDEFQDTDPIQYRIFKKIFNYSFKKITAPLVSYFIADPKQSIYGFRQANIRTYFRAKEEIKQDQLLLSRSTPNKIFYLTDNYRTTAPLLKAVNTLFQATPNPFCQDKLSFDHLSQSKVETNSENQASFLRLHCFNGADPVKEGKRKKEILLNRLVEQLGSNGSQAEFKSTAILVHTNREAREIKMLLDQENIPSVIKNHQTVLESREAEELKLILRAVSQPHEMKYLLAAFSTQAMGYDLFWDLNLIEEGMKRFKDYASVWKSRGFLVMYHRIGLENLVEQNLLSTETPSRSLTNWFHLGELLHYWEEKDRLSPVQLYQKLIQFDHKTRKDGSFELSLQDESLDHSRIKISTIHQSKGLQYQRVHIVLFPKEKRSPFKEAIFYKEDNLDQPYAFLADHLKEKKPYQTYWEQSIREEFSECLRLFYVALTRAEETVDLYLGSDLRFEEKKLNFSQTFNFLIEDARLTEITKKCPSFLISSLDSDLPEESSSRDQTSRKSFPKKLEESKKLLPKLSEWKIPVAIEDYLISFSSLLNQINFTHPSPSKRIDFVDSVTEDIRIAEEENPDRLIFEDETGGQLSPISEINDRVYFKPGVETGLFFHQLLEQWNFSLNRDHLEDLFSKVSPPSGFLNPPRKSLIDFLSRLQSTPLFRGIFSLEEILKDRLNSAPRFSEVREMNFTFKVERHQKDLLKRLRGYMKKHPSWFSDSDHQMSWEETGFYQNGFLTGYIDLVIRKDDRYFIIDWKSNYLGDDLVYYQEDHLKSVMKNRFYHVQALIYLVALEKMLRLHLKEQFSYEKHLGGVSYLFLRGVGLSNKDGVKDEVGDGPPNGVYQFRPTASEFYDFKEIFHSEKAEKN